MRINYGLIIMVFISMFLSILVIIFLAGCKKEPEPKDELPTHEITGAWKTTSSFDNSEGNVYIYNDSIKLENVGYWDYNGYFPYYFSGDTLFMQHYGVYYREMIMQFDGDEMTVYEIISYDTYVFYDRWYKLER